MDKTLAEQLRDMAPRHDASIALTFINAADLLDKQAKALRMAADRFEDLGKITEEQGAYTNAGFFRASARRCRELDF